MKLHKGFTVIEILIVVAILAFASILFFTQKSNVSASARDEARKTSVNSIYHTLESVYYPQHHSYPRTISEKTLPTINPDLLKDPDGTLIGDGKSQFRYEPFNCTDDTTCEGYTLRAILEKEGDFVKKNKKTNA